MLRNLFFDFSGLLFPNVCLACGQALRGGEQHLCTLCRAELPYTDFHRLPPEECPLGRRFWGKLPVRYALSYLRFVQHGRVQELLHQLKYKGQQQVGIALGELYGTELAGANLKKQFDLIVPVPLHRRKLARRGYNQAATFAEGLGTGLELPWSAEALARNEHTASQTRKSRAQRWDNVATVFEVAAPDEVAGQRILLVDDVLTTGATLEACGHALLKANAIEVSIATIACADR